MSRKRDAASPVSFIWKSAILVLAVLMNITLAFRLLWGDQSVAAWQELKRHQADLGEQMETLDQRRAELSREIRLLQTDGAYVERVIRQRLNYVRGNEILYIFDERKPEEGIWAGAEDVDDE